jgi:octanoyl-[GcvH]:protein N-octanoyltransferase
MRVLRGRADTVAADHERTDAMVAEAVDHDEPALRVWTPHQQVAFGRRDARADGYEEAIAAAQRQDFPAVERDVGGRAVAFTGATLAVVHAEPGADRTAIQSRYGDATVRLGRSLDSLGVDAREGEPPDSFCPGTHSLQADGKLAGLAQRVRNDVAVTAAVLLVADHDAVARVLDPVYDTLGVPFDPDSVGSVARAGGPADPERVGDAVVTAFADAEM